MVRLPINATAFAVQAGSRGDKMRMAEPARVVGLQYVISADPHHDTMAVLRLALADAESPLAGREFEVEMPPPHHGQPEFIVLRSRFEAAIQRNWQSEDRCQVNCAAAATYCLYFEPYPLYYACSNFVRKSSYY